MNVRYTPEDVYSMLSRYYLDGVLLKDIAEGYEVTPSTIRPILKGARHGEVFQKFASEHPELGLRQPRRLKLAKKELTKKEVAEIAEVVLDYIEERYGIEH